MKWQILKVCIPALVISAMVAMPQNIIGCGPMMDPYDYYTSFLSKKTVDEKSSKPFFYTSLLTFYDDWDYNDTTGYINDVLIDEWMQYAGGQTQRNDVVKMIYETSLTDVKGLLNAMKQNSMALPAGLKTNSMAVQLLKDKKQDAVAYLQMAKTIEPFCTRPYTWSDEPARDSIKINGYIKQTEDAWKKTADSFFKSKYGFLRCKLAFYNNRLNDCIRWYGEAFDESNQYAVKSLALSYAAGAQFKMGKGKEAAYAFSKAFATSSPSKKKEIFMGFLWATDRCNPQLLDEYISIANTSAEKANMAAMFGLYGAAYHLPVIEKVYTLDKTCVLLPLLVNRELNKLEEHYLTPKLRQQPGSKAFYYTWDEDSVAVSDEQVLKALAFFEKASETETGQYKLLYAGTTSYLHLIAGNTEKAEKFLALAKTMPASNAWKDQLQLIDLLVQTNSIRNLDAATENKLLPALQWLKQKAKQEQEYGMFCRNYFAQILAPAYARQGDVYKTVMAFGVADVSMKPDSSGMTYYGPTNNALQYLQQNMNTEQIKSLYSYLQKNDRSAYDNFLIANNALHKDDAVDMLGTTYLRDFDFATAIEWLRKQSKQTLLKRESYNYKTDKSSYINVNPFHDYVNDVQRYQKPVAKPFTKLSFAEKMLQLEKSLDTIKTNDAKAKVYYQLASAYYNMSYYGNSWMAVAYDRPNSLWNTGNYKADWEKEYFGVQKAKDYYTKAYELTTTNKEFKAAAYFLTAKCAQRQIQSPEYDWNNYEAYESKLKVFQKKFMQNAMFVNFKKEFGATKFYQYAYTRCSYLRDFVAKK